MFGPDLPLVTASLPNGAGSAQVSIKFYGIFQAPPTPPSDKPTIPLLILSSNGLYKVRNWRWCDPAEDDGLTFGIENHALEGISCNCYATATGPTPQGNQVSKCFLGTAKGVYRSFDEGTTWSRCERIAGDDLAVYSLSVVGSCLLAGTDQGFYVSPDDGDTWVRPGTGNSCAAFTAVVSSDSVFGGGFLAQTVTLPASAGGQVRRVSLLLNLRIPESATGIQADAANDGNYLQVWLYATNSGGIPTGALSAPVTIAASDFTRRGFYSVPLTANLGAGTPRIAIVVREVVAQGGVPIFVWARSTQSSPPSLGGAPFSAARLRRG